MFCTGVSYIEVLARDVREMNEEGMGAAADAVLCVFVSSRTILSSYLRGYCNIFYLGLLHLILYEIIK